MATSTTSTGSSSTDRFEGLFAAALTPMTTDGKPNLELIPAYAKKLKDEGIAGVFVCGTSGESMSLTVPERKACLEAWMAFSPSLRVIAQVGTSSVEQSRELAAHAEKVGAAAVACMAPFFFKPNNVEELVAFCGAVAEAASHTPFLYYHYPLITNVHIPLYDFLNLATNRIPTLRGAKCTSHDIGDYHRSLAMHGGRFDILQGYESMVLGSLALGYRGGISLLFSTHGPVFHAIIRAFHQRDFATAQHLQLLVTEYLATLVKYGVVAGSKLLMKELKGLDFGGSRLPLRALSEEEAQKFLNEKSVVDLNKALRDIQTTSQ
jgi:N-acetylneuraminate lyase